ncbi:hypothetical protein [Actinoplanes sp. DH11]|uniref:hypothetical protein n=1 Tax=Actinoplanes sp. DH11 TaxID=2857011 RepID=UPI001E3DDDF2|nr:hypothetical protein [Actinoplanes sp. DH11]
MATTMMDRFVRWNLDFDGDLYGRDERERQLWYEGTTTAAQLQAIAVPWTAAVLVWPLGRAAVLPLAVVLVALLLPLAFGAVYVQHRRVDTVPLVWTRKRLLVGALMGLPYVVFVIGAYQQLSGEPDAWVAPTIGALVGGAFGAVMQARQARKRRLRDAEVVGDED